MQVQSSNTSLNSMCEFVLAFFLIVVTMYSGKTNLERKGLFLFTSPGMSLGESTGGRNLKQIVSSTVKSREK